MNRVPNLTLKEFKKLVRITPMLSSDVIITNDKGEFLLEMRTYPPYVGLWHIPGGFVGYDERLVDTAKRKALQETGLKVKVLRYVGYYDDPKQDSRGRVITMTFLARKTGGKLNPDGLRWFRKMPKDIIPFQRKELKDAGFS